VGYVTHRTPTRNVGGRAKSSMSTSVAETCQIDVRSAVALSRPQRALERHWRGFRAPSVRSRSEERRRPGRRMPGSRVRTKSRTAVTTEPPSGEGSVFCESVRELCARLRRCPPTRRSPRRRAPRRRPRDHAGRSRQPAREDLDLLDSLAVRRKLLAHVLSFVRLAPAGPHRLCHRGRTPVGGEPLCSRS
jgi:hypothetical protein